MILRLFQRRGVRPDELQLAGSHRSEVVGLESEASWWASRARGLRHRILCLKPCKPRHSSAATGFASWICSRSVVHCCAEDLAETPSGFPIGPRDPGCHRDDVTTSAAPALTT